MNQRTLEVFNAALSWYTNPIYGNSKVTDQAQIDEARRYTSMQTMLHHLWDNAPEWAQAHVFTHRGEGFFLEVIPALHSTPPSDTDPEEDGWSVQWTWAYGKRFAPSGFQMMIDFESHQTLTLRPV